MSTQRLNVKTFFNDLLQGRSFSIAGSKRWTPLFLALVLSPIMGCGTSDPVADTGSETSEGGTGTLEIRANGEEFVRQGFTSKDGWDISFDHLYVNLSDITAYQTETPFDPESGEALTPSEQIELDGSYLIDLAEGDENAEPIVVGEATVPAGHYTAVSWQMTPATDGDQAGQVLVLVGQAQKADRQVAFTLQIDQPHGYTCGEYVGDARKGIVAADEAGDVELTFHFDHLFGDGEAPADDEINTEALGFEPLAAIAEGDTLNLDQSQLKAQLSPEDYATFEAMFLDLGHVGEGHCQVEA